MIAGIQGPGFIFRLTREGPQVCLGDFNENDVDLLSLSIPISGVKQLAATAASVKGCSKKTSRKLKHMLRCIDFSPSVTAGKPRSICSIAYPTFLSNLESRS